MFICFGSPVCDVLCCFMLNIYQIYGASQLSRFNAEYICRTRDTFSYIHRTPFTIYHSLQLHPETVCVCVYIHSIVLSKIVLVRDKYRSVTFNAHRNGNRMRVFMQGSGLRLHTQAIHPRVSTTRRVNIYDVGI